MIILCGNLFRKPLTIIFNDCLSHGRFASEWRKAEVAPAHKRGSHCLKNYRPISLLPMCSKKVLFTTQCSHTY